MMDGLKSHWAERSGRERVLLAIMGVLLGVMVLWLGVVRPVEAGLRHARERQALALDGNVAIHAGVAALKALPKGASTLTGPLDQVVGQSAGDAGFTLEPVQPQGPGRVEISIAAARPTALFGWISGLEAQGVLVETITVQPAPTAGTVSVRAVLRGAGQ